MSLSATDRHASRAGWHLITVLAVASDDAARAVCYAVREPPRGKPVWQRPRAWLAHAPRGEPLVVEPMLGAFEVALVGIEDERRDSVASGAARGAADVDG